MKSLIFATAAFGVGLALPRPAVSPQEAGIAPPMRLYLELDGREVEVRLDTNFEIPPSEVPVVGRLRLDSMRRFALPGFEFEYPTEMSFAADLSEPDFDHWSLDGGSTTILVQRYAERGSNVELLESVVIGLREFYEDEGELKEAEMKLGGRELKGYELRVDQDGTSVVQSVFTFQAAETGYALVIADYRDREALGATLERQRLELLLAETFRFDPE